MKSERWSTHNEIRKVLTPDHIKDQGGPILEYRNGRHWKYTGEGHTIIIGSTGSGPFCSMTGKAVSSNSISIFF